MSYLEIKKLKTNRMKTAYANKVKVYNLRLSKKREDKLYAMLETSELYNYIGDMLSELSFEYNHL